MQTNRFRKNLRFGRLAAILNEHTLAPFDLDRRALLAKVPHRRLVGACCAIRPVDSLPCDEWIDGIHRLGLEAVSYEAGSTLDEAAEANEAECLVQALRFVREPKVDAILIIGMTKTNLVPLARATGAAGKQFITALCTAESFAAARAWNGGVGHVR